METVHENELTPFANLRDLGGLRVAGGRTRIGVLWRSDDVALAPPAELHRLRVAGVTTVIDLRSPTERGRTDNGGPASAGLQRHELPFFDLPIDPASMIDHWSDVTTARALGLRYAAMATEAATAIVEGLTIVAESPGATLFHCSAGKDRTGVFAAAVLACLGADRDVIVADYARTSDVMPAVLARMAHRFGGDVADIEQFLGDDSPLLRAPAEAMEVLLDELDHDRGGLVELLRRHGLGDDLLERLPERLVDA